MDSCQHEPPAGCPALGLGMPSEQPSAPPCLIIYMSLPRAPEPLGSPCANAGLLKQDSIR